jgi:hypothetical protein
MKAFFLLLYPDRKGGNSERVTPVPIAEHGSYPKMDVIRSGQICFGIWKTAYNCMAVFQITRIFTQLEIHQSSERLSAPMVLHGRLCGRVGRRRIFFNAFILQRMKAFFLHLAIF